MTKFNYNIRTFKNWWEDNWLTDIYIPFDSVFYSHDVVVTNYIGIKRETNSNGSPPTGKLSGNKWSFCYPLYNLQYKRTFYNLLGY